jgi:hypothetical protein
MALGRHLVAAHIRSVVWVVPLLLGGSPMPLSGQARDTASLIIRQEELDALSSPRFTAPVEARNVLLTTYRELIATQGLKAMRRPAG